MLFRMAMPGSGKPPAERFAEAQREFELMQKTYAGNIPMRDSALSRYQAAFYQQLKLSGHEKACQAYWFAGTRFFHHVVLLESIDVKPLSPDNLQETMTLWREFQAAEEVVAQLGFETVSIEDWRKSQKSPFEHHVETPIFHLFPKQRKPDQPVKLYANEFLQSAQAADSSKG